jgi:multiple sugar transport system permease protein
MTQATEHKKATLGVGAWFFLLLGALVMLGPFYLMFVFATHSRTEIISVPPPLFFGDQFLANLGVLMDKIPFWMNLGWSLYVGLIGTALTLLFCSMAGCAFALYEFRFKKTLFALVMATMLVPSFLGMIPSFLIMDALGWIDQPRALYLPGAAPAMGIFLMRQYIESAIPKELIEAAWRSTERGCSHVGHADTASGARASMYSRMQPRQKGWPQPVSTTSSPSS